MNPEKITILLSGICMSLAIKDGMVLILNWIAALLIRIKGIKLLGGETWVSDPMGAHGAYSFLSILLPMAASLYVEPVRSCAELS